MGESKRTLVTIYIFKGLGFLYTIVTYPFLAYFGYRNLRESNKLKVGIHVSQFMS
jgi:hypothetical protein